MSGTGKRILLGLDTPEQIPVDIYFTCAEKEIQLTVEASRDSKTHELYRICLLPGLCGGVTKYVLPIGEGALIFPENLSAEPTALPVWQHTGLSMPFIGGIKESPGPNHPQRVPGEKESSALALITDSAYASAQLSKNSCDWIYERDPECRRLEIRLFFISNGDHISIARVYRDKLVSERAHVILRKKIRENPEWENLLGSIFVKFDGTEFEKALRFPDNPKKLFIFTFHESHKPDWELYKSVVDKITTNEDFISAHSIKENSELVIDKNKVFGFAYTTDKNESRWDVIEKTIEGVKKENKIGDINQEYLFSELKMIAYDSGGISKLGFQEIPLFSVVYHDSVICYKGITSVFKASFLPALLTLSCPRVFGHVDDEYFEIDLKISQLLSDLHKLTFSAFLKEHQFLTDDFQVQEAIYTDGTRVVVNFSDSKSYEAKDFLLPPLGFFVKHSQLTAHDALRVGEEEFSTRAWRTLRSLDGKPLLESENIERREFV